MRDHFVYWMFADDGDCLYVGMTMQPTKRWQAHRRNFGAEVARKRMAGPYTKQTARAIEREEIKRLRPKYDGYWGKVREREARRQAEAHWPVFTVAEFGERIGMSADMLREWIPAHVTHIRIPEDSEEVLA